MAVDVDRGHGAVLPQTGGVIEDVEVRAAGSKGLGVFARRAFAAGEFTFRRRHGLVVDTAARSCAASLPSSSPTRREYLPHAPAFIRREWHRRNG
jgi:hypothetical protein